MRIDVAFCVNDKFADYIGVTIKSLCETNVSAQIHIHVLTDYISPRRSQRLDEIVKPYDNVTLEVYVVDDSRLRGLKDTWSIYTWYRVLVPDLLPDDVHRILYLDADTLVTGRLDELFTIDMDDRAIACAMDIMSLDDEAFVRCRFDKSKVYVCAGVMLMNLDYWRAHDLSAKIVKYGFDHDAEIRFPDQDTINILCQDTKIVLPLRYGIQDAFFRDERFYAGPLAEDLRECLAHPVIVHYAGCAPWVREFDHTVMHHRWMHYSNMLPVKVRPKYMTRGINGLKVRLHRLIHRRKHLTEADVMSKLRVNPTKNVNREATYFGADFGLQTQERSELRD